jgi:hypothetical protein
VDPAAPTVVLPCPPDQFRDFIANLLGRAQTIEATVDGPYEVTKDNVENLFHLLDQRLSSQNEATLIQFTARVVYNDNSSVLLNSLRDFLVYNEVKPLISVGLHLTWTYLIKFPTKPFPEKQLIQLSFATEREAVTFQSVGALRLAYHEASPINLRIEHTDRTWGADIEALLRGQLEMLRQPIGRARAFANRFSGAIGLLAGTVAFFLTLFATYRIALEFALVQLAKLAEATKGLTGSDLVAHQMNYLVDLIASGVWTRFTLFAAVLFIALLIGSIVLGVTIAEKAHVRIPSFILLTNRSRQHRDIERQALKESWAKLFITFLGGILIGVLSNAIFYFALKYMGVPS